jgi:class 3 adenylate cyclase
LTELGYAATYLELIAVMICRNVSARICLIRSFATAAGCGSKRFVPIVMNRTVLTRGLQNLRSLIDQSQRPHLLSRRVPTPNGYVPRHLAERILASRQSLEGERKQVTVLFADIRGSTRLLEGIDPEEAQKLIDPVLRVMMDAVHRYEGTVNQVLGDGIMALFGAPLAHEDHALRASYSALAMQEEMRRYRRKLGQSEELGLQIGIGLNSGEVVVRSISNDLNVDYSALGHTTHMAATMQELAAGGTTLITASTFDRWKDSFK